jgi:hypothetical protein
MKMNMTMKMDTNTDTDTPMDRSSGPDMDIGIWNFSVRQTSKSASGAYFFFIVFPVTPLYGQSSILKLYYMRQTCTT